MELETSPWDRRPDWRLLGVLVIMIALTSVLALSMFGSQDRVGVNEKLEISNRFSEPVDLHITIEKGLAQPSNEPEIVFDNTVSLSAGESTTLGVLGDYQYYLTVERDGQIMEFGTRPICRDAFTRIIVSNDGDLEHEIRDCE